MVRVLHLLSQSPDFQTERGSAAIARTASTDISITRQTIGRGGDHRNPLLACLQLRGKSAGQYDVIHAWDLPALAAAAGTRTGKILFSAPETAGVASINWPRLLTSRGRVQILCSSAAQQRLFIANRFPPQRCRQIPPGVELRDTRQPHDRALREALGFKEDDYVLLAPGESTLESGHRMVVWAASILHAMDPRWRVLLWGRGSHAAVIGRLANSLNQPNLATFAEGKLGQRVEFEQLLEASDAAMIAAAGLTHTLPIVLGMAAGLPIIAPSTPALSGLLQEETAALVPRCSPRLLAQRAMELRQDPALQARIARAGADRSRELFSIERYVSDVLALYR